MFRVHDVLQKHLLTGEYIRFSGPRLSIIEGHVTHVAFDKRLGFRVSVRGVDGNRYALGSDDLIEILDPVIPVYVTKDRIVQLGWARRVSRENSRISRA